MSDVLHELKLRLLQKSCSGQTIQFKRLSPQLSVDPAKIATADLLLVDHLSSTAQPNPAAELLPLANANEQMLRNATRFQEIIRSRPVIAGICGTDPLRLPEKLLQEVKSLGFVGVQNTPSIGLIDGNFRDHLENSRISYRQEVAMLACARKIGLFTVGTVFSEDHVKVMHAAGVDAIALHPGPKGILSPSSVAKPNLLRTLRACSGTTAETIILMEVAASGVT